MVNTKRKFKTYQNENCPELGLSAQGLRLERSTPVETANFDGDFKQLLDPCEFNTSIEDLFELTGLPQKD